MVWSNTNKVGCGVTEFIDGKWFAKLYTCNYGPAGESQWSGTKSLLWSNINPLITLLLEKLQEITSVVKCTRLDVRAPIVLREHPVHPPTLVFVVCFFFMRSHV